MPRRKTEYIVICKAPDGSWHEEVEPCERWIAESLVASFRASRPDCEFDFMGSIVGRRFLKKQREIFAREQRIKEAVKALAHSMERGRRTLDHEDFLKQGWCVVEDARGIRRMAPMDEQGNILDEWPKNPREPEPRRTRCVI